MDAMASSRGWSHAVSVKGWTSPPGISGSARPSASRGPGDTTSRAEQTSQSTSRLGLWQQGPSSGRTPHRASTSGASVALIDGMSSVPPVAAPAVPFSLLEEEGDDVGTANGLANGWGGRSQVPLADTTPWHVPEGCTPDHAQPPGSSRTSGSSSSLPASHQGSTSRGASQGDAAGLRADTASARSRRPPRPSALPPPVGGREGEGWSAATDAASSAALHRGAAVQEGGWREELDGLGLEADAWLAENWDPAWGPSPTQPQPPVSGHWNKGGWWQGADVVDVESVEGSEGEEREGERWMDAPRPDDVEGEVWVDAGDVAAAAHEAWGAGYDVVNQGGQGDDDAAEPEGHAIDGYAVQEQEQQQEDWYQAPSRPQSGKVAGMHDGFERGRGQAVSRSRRSHSQQRYMAALAAHPPVKTYGAPASIASTDSFMGRGGPHRRRGVPPVDMATAPLAMTPDVWAKGLRRPGPPPAKSSGPARGRRPAPVPPRSEPVPEPPADLMYLAEEWTLPPSGTPSGGDGLRVDKGSPRHRVGEAGGVDDAAPSMTRLVTHTMDPRPRPGDLDGTGRDVIALASLASNVYMAKFLEGVRGLLHTCSIRLDHVDFAGLRRVAHRAASVGSGARGIVTVTVALCIVLLDEDVLRRPGALDLSFADAAGLLGATDLKQQLLLVDPRWYGPDVPHALQTLVRAVRQQNAVARVPQLPALCDWILALCDLIVFYHSHTEYLREQDAELLGATVPIAKILL